MSDVNTLVHVRYVELSNRQGQTAVTAREVNVFQGIASKQQTLVSWYAGLRSTMRSMPNVSAWTGRRGAVLTKTSQGN
ncbi:MAG: hypothetical protein LBH06_09340 [Rikenellaceae bacterium]|nr:hypothetical protein [Rikenellaceae bacterium]